MVGASRLEGRVAIVTGSGQGIGADYAVALAAAGARVAIADIGETRSTATRIREAGGEAVAIHTDVTDASSVGMLVGETLAAFGGVDILVNNAAIFSNLRGKPFEEISSDEWDRVLAVNLRGVFECCKAVAPHMRRAGGGKIVNVASATVFKGSPMLLHYVASKGAVVAMTRALARELGPDRITVNCIAPGFTLSEGVSANEFYTADFRAANAATRALARDMRPDDLIGPLIFLCAPESDFMTGQTVVVDGGSVMH